MEEVTNFSMKNFLTIASLAKKCLNSLRDENDEPIFAYTDPFMKDFLRNSKNGSMCNAFSQQYKSEIDDEVFIKNSEKIKVNSNICDLPERYFEFLNKYEKLYAKEFDLKYEDYRNFNQKEKIDFNNNKLNILLIHEKLSRVDIKKHKWFLKQLLYILQQCGLIIQYIRKQRLVMHKNLI